MALASLELDMRDLLSPDKGTGLLSRTADREVRELHDPAHPRQTLSPFTEIEVNDEQVALAAEDEWKTCFCPDTHPKPPHPKEEGVTSLDGSRMADLMADTPPIEVELDMMPVGQGDGLDDLMGEPLGVDDSPGLK